MRLQDAIGTLNSLAYDDHAHESRGNPGVQKIAFSAQVNGFEYDRETGLYAGDVDVDEEEITAAVRDSEPDDEVDIVWWIANRDFFPRIEAGWARIEAL